MPSLRIGSRGSQLALWQANHVAALLRERGHQVTTEIIRTTGDKMAEVALAQVGTKGMFIKEIEEALQEGRVDLAVHSLKDLPTELSSQFELAAVMKRADARDALIAKSPSLAALPEQARVGTSSLRREAQLRALRSDLQVLSLRGNVDTRLGKLERGEFDAIILAGAGVKRLGRENVIRELLDIESMCPAAGQGALAVECRAGDRVRAELTFLDDAATRTCTECERALLQALGGGCQVPVGAYAEMRQGKIHLLAKVGRPNGSLMLKEQGEGTDALALGREVGERLLRRGAEGILQETYRMKPAVPEQP